MLELRPNCERCYVDLPPSSSQARICSYECTFCADCVEHLRNVCPNCGGGFVTRPIRPAHSWRPATGLDHNPPSTTRHHLHYSEHEIAILVKELWAVAPGTR